MIEVPVRCRFIIYCLSIDWLELVMNLVVFGSSVLWFEVSVTTRESTGIWKQKVIVILHGRGVVYRCSTEYGWGEWERAPKQWLPNNVEPGRASENNLMQQTQHIPKVYVNIPPKYFPTNFRCVPSTILYYVCCQSHYPPSWHKRERVHLEYVFFLEPPWDAQPFSLQNLAM